MKNEQKLVVLDEKRKDLKPIELKFLYEYINNGGNAIQAYATIRGCDLYDKKEYHNCNVKSARMFKKIKPSIQEEMEAQGLTEKKIVELIIEGTQAYRIDQFDRKIPDFKVRGDYLEIICKIRNLFPRPGIDINYNKQNNVLVVPGIISDEKKWVEKLEQVREITDEMRMIEYDKEQK